MSDKINSFVLFNTLIDCVVHIELGMGILSKGTRAEKAERTLQLSIFFGINTSLEEKEEEGTELCLVLFNLYDKDGNGVLDAEELKQLQKSYCKASKAAFMVGFR